MSIKVKDKVCELKPLYSREHRYPPCRGHKGTITFKYCVRKGQKLVVETHTSAEEGGGAVRTHKTWPFCHGIYHSKYSEQYRWANLSEASKRKTSASPPRSLALRLTSSSCSCIAKIVLLSTAVPIQHRGRGRLCHCCGQAAEPATALHTEQSIHQLWSVSGAHLPSLS